MTLSTVSCTSLLSFVEIFDKGHIEDMFNTTLFSVKVYLLYVDKASGLTEEDVMIS